MSRTTASTVRLNAILLMLAAVGGVGTTHTASAGEHSSHLRAGALLVVNLRGDPNRRSFDSLPVGRVLAVSNGGATIVARNPHYPYNSDLALSPDGWRVAFAQDGTWIVKVNVA